MKKILIVLLMMLMITGCSNTESKDVLFVKNDKKYALCVEGKLKSDYEYDKFVAVDNNGFIVSNGKKESYISYSGKELIAYRKNVDLETAGNMVIAVDKNKNYTIYNSEGKELYKSDKKTEISLYGLPVVYKNNKYLVLNKDGEVLIESKKKVNYVSLYSDTIYVVSYKDSTVIYDDSVDSTIDEEGLKINVKGQFNLIARDFDKGFLLQDKEEKRLVFVGPKGKVKFDIEKDIDKAMMSEDTIYAKKDDDIYIMSLDGKTNIKATSYYNDSHTYLIKNDSYVYGPHQFVNKGRSKDVTGIQLNPKVQKANHDIFPVYVQTKGYQYYNFAGKVKIKTYFKSADDFSNYGVAVVSKDGSTYYLINEKGEKVSQKYKAIQYMGKGYYAAYETTTKFEIIDAHGEKVIDDYFMGNFDIFVFDNKTYGLFNKSGTTHVYDMNEYEEEFALNGEYKVYQDRYLVSTDYKKYYDMNGEEVYKR